MAGQHPAPTVDAYDYLKIVRNPDGTITRRLDFLHTPAVPDLDQPFAVRSKDVLLNPTRNIWARIYLPCPPTPSDHKLPLIVYYHGGGFICFSPSSLMTHDFCALMAAKLSAVVVSASYRLAPEHRLPAAYDDAVEALRWVRTTEEDWLRQRVDFSRCFLMGSSSGGNIAYHAGMSACAAAADLEPLVIRGLILHHPFFGGSRRTESEVRLFNNPILPVNVTDVMWELALPASADRDHEYCNPMAVERSEEWERMRTKGWRVVVAGGGGDPLIDRQRELMAELEAKGVQVVGLFGGEGDCHAVEMMEPDKAELFMEKLKEIVSAGGSARPVAGDGKINGGQRRRASIQ